MNAEVLPENKQAEAAIIGSLLSSEYLNYFEECEQLTPDHFAYRQHRIIFQSIMALNSASLPVNLVSACNDLESKSKLEEAGGAYAISVLAKTFCPIPNFRHYVEQIVEAFKLRSIVDIAHNALTASKSGVSSSKEVLDVLETQVFSLSNSSGPDNQNRLIPASEELQRMIDVRRAGEKVFGLQSGIAGFDDIFGGFQKGQYYVLAARPSTGKTAFVDQVTIHLVTRGHPVMYVSLEAGEERVLGKMACKLAQVCYSDFSLGKCSPPELDEIEAALKLLKKSPLIIIRPSDLTASDIRTLIRKEYRSRKIELVVLDYIQKITVPARTELRIAIGDASQQIGRACVETGVPALILAQLNRDAEKESRPRMGHLKESGQIEQDADNVALLWSEVDRTTLQPGAKVPIIMTVEKNRDGMSQFDQKLFFNGRLMTFEKRIV